MMFRMLSVLLAIFMIAIAQAKIETHVNMTNLPHFKLGLNFDSMTCSICEKTMTIVSKQIGDQVDLKEEGLKIAIKGACAYLTLANPLTLPLCSIISEKLVSYMVDDIAERTYKVLPKSQCRMVGMCPPCKATNGKFVMAKKPNLPLPWDNNKHLHRHIVEKYSAVHAQKRKQLHVQYMRNLTNMAPARQKAVFDGMKCYGCKSVMGMVGKDVTDVKSAGRAILINSIKTTCKSYASMIPMSGKLCDYFADNLVGTLADSIMKDAQIKPAENCRTLGACPQCSGKCPDEEEVEQTKEATKKGHQNLPPVDTECSEPLPPIAAKSCEDNYPDRCKSGEGSCYDTTYKRMMKMECVFTCVCSWLPWGLGR